jgi:GT2 family glycosyltransferase
LVDDATSASGDLGGEPRPDVSVVVVSYQTREMLGACLRSCRHDAAALRVELVVVDNASSDGSPEMVARDFPDARLVRSGSNLGFAAACNRGLAVARGRHVVLLNPDARLQPGALATAVRRMDEQPRTGLAGARLLSADGAPQPSARMFPSVLNTLLFLTGLPDSRPHSRFFGRANRTWASPEQPAEVDWVPGAFSIVRADLLARLGGFDERFYFYFEEVDLCRRVRAAGYSVCYWPDVVVVHEGAGASRGRDGFRADVPPGRLAHWRMRSELLYFRKHHGAAGAWLAAASQNAFHRLRGLRNRLGRDPARRGRAEVSAALVAAMHRAWRETRGGRECPPRPW